MTTSTATLHIGHGYDIHRLIPGKPLVIGGVTIPFEKGFDAHSDGDVLIHALCDALLGAAALGDIGRHFPDTDPQWKGTGSLFFLKQVRALLDKQHYGVVNLDSTVIAQAPRLSPHIEAMQSHLAAALCIPPTAVSIKASTPDGLGVLGKGLAIEAHAVVLIAGQR